MEKPGLPENNNTNFNTRKRSVSCIILGTRKVSDSQKRDQKTWMVLRRHYPLEKRRLYFIEEKELEDGIRNHDAHTHQRYQSGAGSSLWLLCHNVDSVHLKLCLHEPYKSHRKETPSDYDTGIPGLCEHHLSMKVKILMQNLVQAY